MVYVVIILILLLCIINRSKDADVGDRVITGIMIVILLISLITTIFFK